MAESDNVDDNEPIKEEGGILPALIIDWSAKKLLKWIEVEAQHFGAETWLEDYTSQAQNILDRILIKHSLVQDHQIAELYFGDKKEWSIQHYFTPIGKAISYHIYRKLLHDGIAVKFEKTISPNLTSEEKFILTLNNNQKTYWEIYKDWRFRTAAGQHISQEKLIREKDPDDTDLHLKTLGNLVPKFKEAFKDIFKGG